MRSRTGAARPAAPVSRFGARTQLDCIRAATTCLLELRETSTESHELMNLRGFARGTPTALVRFTKETHQMDHNTFAELSSAELDHVTGGGWKSKVAKLAKKGGEKVVEAAKWTGIPAAIGGGAAWVKRQFE